MRDTVNKPFHGFAQFYPYYLGEHSNHICRRLHFVGSTGVLVFVGTAILSRNPAWLIATPLCGYGFAWIGHYVFEKNKPATFRHPLYSLMGDWVMYRDMWIGRVPF